MSEPGNEIRVVNINEDHSFSLEIESLKKLLLRDDVKDVPVAVISIAGPYRGGKSFILNFFLRYLKASQTARDDGTWMGGDDEVLTGFNWRGGSIRNTTGMMLWSEPLFITDADAKKTIVLLMDTQGTFDRSSSVRDCSTIFALSSLVSSLQIYNIFTTIREDDLQQLELFVAYGNLLQDKTGKPFQELQFLIRDWPYPYEFAYGKEGGRLFIEDKLKVDGDQPKELQDIRKHVKDSFEQTSCFLMPSPGPKVMEKDFKGQLKDLNENFKTHLKELVSSTFTGGKMTVKKLHGKQLVASELLVYLQSYIQSFNSGGLPSPSTIWEATSSASVSIATNKAIAAYDERMKQDCALSMTEESLRNINSVARAHALTVFSNTKKISSETVLQTATDDLNKEMSSRFSNYTSVNFSKTLAAKQSATAAFHKYVKEASNNPMCMNNDKLQEIINIAIESALKDFDSKRRPSEVDEDRNGLKTSLEALTPALSTTNEINIKMVMTSSKDRYWSDMYPHVQNDSPMSRQTLRYYHNDKQQSAVNGFLSEYRSSEPSGTDPNVIKLKEKIAVLYNTINTANERKIEQEREWQEQIERQRRERERQIQEARDAWYREQRYREEQERRWREEEQRRNSGGCTIL